MESARIDQRGVSFAIDFSGSTNIVLLPAQGASLRAQARDSPTERGSDDRANFSAVQEHRQAEGDTDIIEGKHESHDNVVLRDETILMSPGDEGESLSAAVSVGAFCRTVVARIAIRDPGVVGAIKARYFCVRLIILTLGLCSGPNNRGNAVQRLPLKPCMRGRK